MRNNLLYYHPLNADILLNSMDEPPEKVKRAKKYFSVLLGHMLVNGGFLCENGSLANKLHKKYSGMLRLIIPLGMAFFICILSFAVSSELPDNSAVGNAIACVGAVLIIPSVALYVVLGVLMWMLFNYKKQLLKYYLDGYVPRCRDYNDDFREELANAGYDTTLNQAEIEDGMNVSEELLEELKHSEKYIYLENCVCIACKSRMNCGEITEFDNYTAICPKCGEKAIIPDLDNDISDDFLYALNKYWFAE